MHSFNALLSTSSTPFNAPSAESTSSPPKVSTIMDSPYQYIVNRNVNQLDSKSNESHNQKSNPHSSWNVNELYRHQSRSVDTRGGDWRHLFGLVLYICWGRMRRLGQSRGGHPEVLSVGQTLRRENTKMRRGDFGNLEMAGRWIRVWNCLQLYRSFKVNSCVLFRDTKSVFRRSATSENGKLLAVLELSKFELKSLNLILWDVILYSYVSMAYCVGWGSEHQSKFEKHSSKGGYY